MPTIPCSIHQTLTICPHRFPASSTRPFSQARSRGPLCCRAGILDSYRAEKGQAPAKEVADKPQQQLEQEQQPVGQEEGEEEGACTAQCVREVTSGTMHTLLADAASSLAGICL